jgi:hypothetical protein
MRKISIIAVLCMASAISYSQKIMHAYGMNLAEISSKKTVNIPGVPFPITEKFSLSQAMISYFIRYNVLEKNNASLSIGVPVSIGISIVENDAGFTTDRGIGFSYDLPVVMDYNFGCKSTLQNEKKFGGYVGTGFGYFRANISGSNSSNLTTSTYGPIFRVGFRFRSNAENWKGHGIAVGLYYKKGLETKKISTFGTTVYLDI